MPSSSRPGTSKTKRSSLGKVAPLPSLPSLPSNPALSTASASLLSTGPFPDDPTKTTDDDPDASYIAHEILADAAEKKILQSQAYDSRGRGKKRSRGHRVPIAASGLPTAVDLHQLLCILRQHEDKIERHQAEINDLKTDARKQERQAEADRRNGEREREALAAELRKAQEEIRQLFNDYTDLQERLAILEDWANSTKGSKKSYPLTKIRLRAIIDTTQAHLARKLNLRCGPTIMSASLAWRIFIGQGVDLGESVEEQDRQRLAAAHSALMPLQTNPSIQALKGSKEGMRMLTQTHSGIRIRGNAEAHSLGNSVHLKALVQSPIAGLRECDKTGLLAVIDFIYRN